MIKNKKEKVKSDQKNILPIAFLMAFIVGIVLFYAMVHIEKETLANYEKKTLIVASTEVPEKMLITEDNIDNYFVSKEIDKNIYPENAIIEKESLYGLAPVYTISSGTAVTNNMFDNIDEKINAMTDPRSVGAGSTDLSQIVSGIVRPGDTIDIYVIANKNNGENYYTTPDKEDMLYSNVYVLDAFDSAGTPIMNGDSTSVCERINFLMENSEINNYYNAITDSTVYYVKHIDWWLLKESCIITALF